MYGRALPSTTNWLLMRMACRFCDHVNCAWILLFFPSGESGIFASHSCFVRNAIGFKDDVASDPAGVSARRGVHSVAPTRSRTLPRYISFMIQFVTEARLARL